MKLITLLLKILLSIFLGVAIVQISAVYLLRLLQPELEPADLVSIMPGSKERVTSGCMIAIDPGAAHLMLINNSPKALGKHAARLDVPESVTLLPGGQSRSSFEDIYITIQTAQDKKLTSIILVTSDYHLPRALFMLHAYSRASGKDLSIQYLSTQSEKNLQTRVKLFYNEIVKFWGSTIEMLGCVLSGQRPLDSKRVLSVRDVLKNVLLFEV